MQPSYEVSLSRPWHWGIAILSAVGASVPEQLDQSVVTGRPDCLVVKMRHAQDIDAEVFEGGWDWATAAIHLRSLPDFDQPAGTVVYEGVLTLPVGRLSVGDADSEMILNDLQPRTRVRILVDEVAEHAPSAVTVDLAP
jgi:hypothetical protein